MLSTILAGMGATPKASSRLEATRASPARSASSIITGEIDAASDPQSVSSSSTPPTSIGDEASISSTTLKAELVASAPSTPAVEGRARSQRERKSVATYNVKVLTGTAVHAPRKYCKNPDGTPVDVTKTVRRRTISGDTLVGASKSANASTASLVKDNDRLVRDGIDALDLQWSVKKLPRSKSQIGLAGDAKKPVKSSPLKRSKSLYTKSAVQKITDKFGTGKRRGGAIEEDIASGATRFKRELRKLQDTPEFAKIETEPIFHEVWSNGKLVQEERPRKKKKVEDAPQVQEPEPVEKNVNVKKEKTWQSKGLFAGQSGFENIYEKMPKGTAKPDDYGLAEMKTTTRSILPLPQGAGQRTLHVGRDFKLPFDICSPLPPGQPKPDEWRKTSSNRFVGTASQVWRKVDMNDISKCVCSPDEGCDEQCQNRTMLYECDDKNCNVGKAACGNRAFDELQERRKAGGKYRVGVEVLKTADRGFGVRSNRCFEANQIIVEYTGEIITEEECDKRMNNEYKHNECYYLMSFDQNMILDGTKGSIARFVNHSCKPNCRMVKWLVAGKPRMALFAGDSPIMTGDELTYDYNFDPFSAKNIQACRCGSDNCRGVLGPKPKDPKTVKETIKDAVKATKKLAKRKFKEALGVRDDDDSDPAPSPKKRKIKAPTTLKRSKSAASMKVVAKDAVKSVRKSVSSQILNARSKVVTVKRETVTTTKTKTKKTYKVNSVRTYGSSRRSKVTPRRSRAMTLASLGTPEKMASVGKRLTKPTTKRKEDNMVHLDTIVAIARSGSSATYKSPYAPVSAPVTPSKESTIRVVRSPLEDMEVDDTVDDDGTIEVDDSMEVDDTEDEM